MALLGTASDQSHLNKSTLVMAIFGLAFVGSAFAVGYRNMFASSVSPTLPPSIKTISGPNTIASVNEFGKQQAAAMHVTRPVTPGSIDNMVSVGTSKAAPRASLPRATARAMPAAGQAVPKQAVPRIALTADPPGPPPTLPF